MIFLKISSEKKRKEKVVRTSTLKITDFESLEIPKNHHKFREIALRINQTDKKPGHLMITH